MPYISISVWPCQPYLKGIDNRFPYSEKHLKLRAHSFSLSESLLRQKCHTFTLYTLFFLFLQQNNYHRPIIKMR